VSENDKYHYAGITKVAVKSWEWTPEEKSFEATSEKTQKVETSVSRKIQQSGTTEAGATWSAPTRSGSGDRQLVETATGGRPDDLRLRCIQL